MGTWQDSHNFFRLAIAPADLVFGTADETAMFHVQDVGFLGYACVHLRPFQPDDVLMPIQAPLREIGSRSGPLLCQGPLALPEDFL